ncbi:hypothetical protein PCK1_000107 [Pneumocystis canis]|nr:hypothetical protein PCK1_000107 [Pneumocystis canis]
MKKTVSNKKNKKYTFKSFKEHLNDLHINISNKINYYIDDDINSSYFNSSLQEWRELNLSPDLIAFFNEICIFSESLPQILYHKQKIFNIITKYISKNNPLSLEPFLSLLVSFSRDLKEEFNPFIIETFKLLESLLDYEHINVIEWTFNTIAYLFKYLSEVVLNNFEKIFQILSKLLGKTTTKLYIIRYTAETVAFLFKRINNMQKIMLIKLFGTDLQNNFSNLYLEGISLIISESCKNIKKTLNSKTAKIITHLIEAWEQDSQKEVLYLILKNTIISLINHADEITFFPIIELLLTSFKTSEFHDLHNYHHLLLICVSTQNGKKIKDWKVIIDYIVSSLPVKYEYSPTLVKLIAYVLCFSDLNTVTLNNKKIIDHLMLSDIDTCRVFFELVSIISADRFNMFLLHYFHSFICKIWKTHQDVAISLLLSINDSKVLMNSSENSYISGKKKFNFSSNHYIIESILKYFSELINKTSFEIFTKNKILTWKQLKLISCIDFDSKQFNQILYKFTIKCLTSEFDSDIEPILQILLTELSSTKCDGLKDNNIINLFNHISESSNRFSKNILFLQGVFVIFEDILVRPLKFNDINIELLFSNILSNLLITGSQRRFYTIKILTLLCKLKSNINCKILESCNIIAETPFTIESLRIISSHIRKISANFLQAQDISQKIAMIFLIGLMTTNFSPICKDCSLVLATLYNKNYTFIWKYIFDWIKLGNIKKIILELNEKCQSKSKNDIIFQCFKTDIDLNFLQIKQNNDEKILSNWKRLCNKNDLDLNSGSTEYRSHALKILLEVPQLAEEYSEDLVPIFLSVFTQNKKNTENLYLSDFEWSYADKLNFITIFSKFQNPNSIFKSKDVYNTQLLLLSQGDIKLQSLALDSILSWKFPKVLHYKNNLQNLLNTIKFHDELTDLIQENRLYNSENQQLFTIILRILYGRMISRSDPSRKRSFSTKRNVILSSLNILPPEFFKIFLKIMLEPFDEISCIDKSNPNTYKLKNIQGNIDQRKMIGFCDALKGILKELGSKIMLYLQDILNAHFYCWNNSESIIKSFCDKETKDDKNIHLKYAKAIRYKCYQNLNKMFSFGFNHEWIPYMNLLFTEFINPKLKTLDINSSQIPSGLLKIFSTWSENLSTLPFLYDYNQEIILEITKCLSLPSTKENVILFIFDFYKKILTHINKLNEISENNEHCFIKEIFISKHIPIISNILCNLLISQQHKWGKNIYQSLINLLSLISPLINEESQTDILLQTNIFIISKLSKIISEDTKNSILKTIQNLLPLSGKIHDDHCFFYNIFKTLIPLFGTLKNKNSRIILSDLMNMLSKFNSKLSEISTLIIDLNSLSSSKLDQPDFDRVLSAFNIINNSKWKNFNIISWAPLIYNMMYFIQDEDEFSIRTNATYTMKRFIERFKDISITEREPYLELLSSILKALKKEIKSNRDLVKQEYLSVLAHIVKFCSFWEAVSDLEILLINDDEEANFFNNILHIQQHRRIRALKRLCIASSDGKINKNNISQIFLPLIESLCFYSPKQYHNLVSEAIKSIGILCANIHWNQYYNLFRRYIMKLKNDENTLKIIIRIIDSITNTLYHAYGFSLINLQKSNEIKDSFKNSENDSKNHSNNNNIYHSLKTSITNDIHLENIICSEFIPPLIEILRKTDISTIIARIPIALTITKLLKCLNYDNLTSHLPLVLSEICKVLQNRSQNHRDIARQILSDIIGLLGPQYLFSILIQLKNTLKRGYQLHVLGFTVHTLLYRLQNIVIGSIDNCTNIIAEILIDDIFGDVGIEKNSEEYITSMKEVKTNKSYDSFEILSSIINLEYFAVLLNPIFRLLHEKLTLEVLKNLDIIFKRISRGIFKNPLCCTRDGLRLCYNLFQEGIKQFGLKHNDKTNTKDPCVLESDFHKKTGNNFSNNAYKITKFSLDLLKGILSKNETLISSENLIPFIPIIGDSVLSGNEELQISSLNLFIIFLKLDVEQVNSSLHVFVDQALLFIKISVSSNTELCQTSLKFLISVFKNHKNIKIKEEWLIDILAKIKLDIEEPNRQGITFSMIKAIMSQKFIFAELYDLIDSIANMMITNQSKVARNMARGIYYQFLLNYPQGKGRLKKQMDFLIRNLEYEHASGRQSVIETINLIVSNFDDSIIEEFLEPFFIALIMVIVNDNDKQSRNMSGILLQKIFKRSNNSILKFISESLKTWLNQTEIISLKIAAIQGYGFLFQTFKKAKSEEINYFLEKTQFILNKLINSSNTEDFELIYQIMLTMFKLVNLVPEIIMSTKQLALWKLFMNLLANENNKICFIATVLIGKSLSFCKPIPKKLPLISSYGLSYTQNDLSTISDTILRKFFNSEISNELSLQFSKNLLFIAQCYHLTNAKVSEFENSLYIHPKIKKRTKSKEINTEHSTCLEWLVFRLCILLRNEKNINLESVIASKHQIIKLIRALVNFLPTEDLEKLANLIINPLYKYTDTKIAMANNQKDLKYVAQEILEELHSKIGTTLYIQIFNNIKQESLKMRENRKLKRSILSVSNPEILARKKIKLNIKKIKSKKKKYALFHLKGISKT